jgi:hypothetical protein
MHYAFRVDDCGIQERHLGIGVVSRWFAGVRLVFGGVQVLETGHR